MHMYYIHAHLGTERWLPMDTNDRYKTTLLKGTEALLILLPLNPAEGIKIASTVRTKSIYA